MAEKGGKGKKSDENGGGMKRHTRLMNSLADDECIAASDEVIEEARPHGHSFLPPLVPAGAYAGSSDLADRQASEVVVQGEPANITAPPIINFSQLEEVMPSYVVSSLARAGIVAPVPIQQWTLPFTLRGFNLIGIARTGSGKTLAYLLPAIAHVERLALPHGSKPLPTAAIILAPVRELAVQIGEEANKICKPSGSANNGIGCVACYGGGGSFRNEQLQELRAGHGQIVVGTPGRMMEFVSQGTIDVSSVVFFVLDEADRMLDGGFEEHLLAISSKIPPYRQTLFFSATWPAHVRKCANDMCKAPPVRVSVGQSAGSQGPTTRSDITQEVIVFDSGRCHPPPQSVRQRIWDEKMAKMNAHLRQWLSSRDSKILVFVNTKVMAREVSEELCKEGFASDYMSGERGQIERNDTLKRFKEGALKLVVATDVMARGLDIQGVSHVLVFDCYGGIDDYVHRIGRTNRGFEQKYGYALVFYDWDPNFASMPADITKVLQTAGQPVPHELQQIADEVTQGLRNQTASKKRKY